MTRNDGDWLTETLAELHSESDPQRWPTARALKDRANGRRRRRRVGLSLAGAAVIAAAVLVPLSRSSTPAPTAAPAPNAHLDIVGRSGPAIELAANASSPIGKAARGLETSLAGDEEAFSLSLLHHLDAGSSSAANVVASPSSLATVLAMLELGARGSTAAQIAAVLGTSNLTGSQQGAAWRELEVDETQAAAQAGIDLESANSLWTQKGLPLLPGFMADLNQEFATGVWQVDFAAHPVGANAAINAWVSDQTHGRITQLFSPGSINAMTALVLANASYFNASWQQAFDVGMTAGAIFHTADGRRERVFFMKSLGGDMKFSIPVELYNQPKNPQSEYDAVQIPYAGKRFAALVLMPTSGTLNNFVDNLTPASLDRIVRGLRSGTLRLSMPRFELRNHYDLNSTLQAMGMADAFGNADFSALSTTPLAIQQVQQSTFLKVDEQGTQAAAASGGSVEAVSAPLGITINRPFLFLVRDTTTGAILYESEVENPNP